MIVWEKGMKACDSPIFACVVCSRCARHEDVLWYPLALANDQEVLDRPYFCRPCRPVR